MTAQLKYLSRDGDLELEQADGDIRGLVETRGEIEEIAELWADDWKQAAGQDQRFARAKTNTFHLLVSFPEGTDTERAKAAAWTFADRLCHSGDYGDEWRNVRAWHEDRAHPHMHLVIDRRGESGRMMKIHPAADINPKVLRALQVDTAAEQGIALNDTPRSSRGITRQPESSREWRAERGPQPRGRTKMRDRYADLTRRFAVDTARREAEAQRELAVRLQSRGQIGLADTVQGAARTLEAGGELRTMDGEAAREITPEDLQAMDEETLSKTITDAVREVEELAPRMTDENERAALEVETGQIRREFAHLLPEEERPEHSREVGQGRMRDLLGQEAAIATRGRLGEHEPDGDANSPNLNHASRTESSDRDNADPWVQVEAADARVIEAYEAKGLNGQRVLARIIGGKEAEPETLDYWREEEIKELMREGDVPRTVATREIDDLQKFASGTYREAERQIERGVDRDPQNEIERDRPDDARRSVEREAVAAERAEPETDRATPELLSEEELSARLQRGEQALEQARRDGLAPETEISNGRGLDFG